MLRPGAPVPRLPSTERDNRLSMAGVEGTSLPGRMAEINEVLNALPVPLRERLLVEYLNLLYRPED